MSHSFSSIACDALRIQGCLGEQQEVSWLDVCDQLVTIKVIRILSGAKYRGGGARRCARRLDMQRRQPRLVPCESKNYQVLAKYPRIIAKEYSNRE